ncbi:Uncharacterised protein [Yersinia intermedia]|mgnify:CR=1 FL=1|nr:Uncharacterised protein [Yersinia intermedia]
MRCINLTELSPSSFKLQGCWLLSLTRITYWCKLIGMHSFAAYLQSEIYRGYSFSFKLQGCWRHFGLVSDHPIAAAGFLPVQIPP